MRTLLLLSALFFGCAESPVIGPDHDAETRALGVVWDQALEMEDAARPRLIHWIAPECDTSTAGGVTVVASGLCASVTVKCDAPAGCPGEMWIAWRGSISSSIGFPFGLLMWRNFLYGHGLISLDGDDDRAARIAIALERAGL
jgi:hypothetical protein